jgi:uncharacterized protein (TIGR02453 family)
MAFVGFSDSTFRFLSELARHDDPAWFEAQKDSYESVFVEPAKALVEALGPRLKDFDPKIHAIPRVRGSIKALERRRRFPRRDAPRYKDSLDLWFWSGRRRAWDNSGFFLRLTPTRLVLAAGMIEFQKETLVRYRERLLDDARGAELSTIVSELRAAGYVVGGESYLRTPKGVPPDHPRASLAKHRGLFATRDMEHPPELGTPHFPELVMEHFARMAPLHAWLVPLGSP